MTSVADPALETSTAPPASALASTFVGRRYVQLVVVLGALMAIGPLTIDTYLPALPQLSAEMGATDSQAQLTITGLLLGLGFGQLIIGPLSDAFGRRRPLLIGLAAHGVDVAALRSGALDRPARRDAYAAGPGRCRGRRGRHGGGAGPVHRDPRRQAAVAAASWCSAWRPSWRRPSAARCSTSPRGAASSSSSPSLRSASGCWPGGPCRRRCRPSVASRRPTPDRFARTAGCSPTRCSWSWSPWPG